MLQIVHWCVSS